MIVNNGSGDQKEFFPTVSVPDIGRPITRIANYSQLKAHRSQLNAIRSLPALVIEPLGTDQETEPLLGLACGGYL